VVNVLTAEQHTVADLFARPGGGFPLQVPHSTSRDGLPVLTGSAATAHCSVAVVHPGGDHDIVVARIGAVYVHSSDPPLTYWRGAYSSAHDLEEPSCLP
jgi:flavin reductase (DIM6/NTAB) family NADH-FMN oxidoreductase RutF